MQLPRAIPKPAKRASRWKSQAHLNWVRSRACSMCDSTANVEAAHVRMGSGAGMGQKPDDWRAVSLCGPQLDGAAGCHHTQHYLGEETFWRGKDVEGLIAAFIKGSPKRREIEEAMRERGL